MKVYTAYPSPMNKMAQVGTVYNDMGQILWDCRCGLEGLSIGEEHNCFATKEEEAAITLQREVEKLGEPTEHPNIREIPAGDIPSKFLDWLNKIL